jgi:intein/homing endonuclease
VYRHKTTKRRFRLRDTEGNSVEVTEDHSVIVIEDGQLVAKKPTQIQPGDKIIGLRDADVKSVTE